MTHLGSHKIGSTVRYAVAMHGTDGNAVDPTYVACTHIDPSGTATALTAPAKVNSIVGLYGGVIDTTGYAIGEHFFYVEYTIPTSINRIHVITLDVYNNDIDGVAAIAGATTAKNKAYSATSRVLNAGTEPAGALSAAATHNDTYWDIQEQASGDGINVEVTFYIDIGVLAPTVQFIGRYQGTNTHHVDVEAYNWETSGWEELAPTEADELTHSTSDYQKEFPLNSHHVSSGGAVVVRLLHDATSGALSTSHHLYVDKLAVLAAEVIPTASQTSVDAIKAQLDDNTNGLTATRNLAYNASSNSYAAAVDAAAAHAVIDNIHDTDLPAVKQVADDIYSKVDTEIGALQTSVNAIPTTSGATLAQIEASDALGNHIADHVWDEPVSGHTTQSQFGGYMSGIIYGTLSSAYNNTLSTVRYLFSLMSNVFGLSLRLGGVPSISTTQSAYQRQSGILLDQCQSEAIYALAGITHKTVGSATVQGRTGYSTGITAADRVLRDPFYHIKMKGYTSNTSQSVASGYMNPGGNNDKLMCTACGDEYGGDLNWTCNATGITLNGCSQATMDWLNTHAAHSQEALPQFRFEDAIDAVAEAVDAVDTSGIAAVSGKCDDILEAIAALPDEVYTDELQAITAAVEVIRQKAVNRRKVVDNEDGTMTETVYSDGGAVAYEHTITKTDTTVDRGKAV